ncbi:MAG TPA: phosphoribosylaminoimidazolesuccinocarboxamide synthase [Saprospiraceae bacterium]|nr:phosphoribosylaminoimidazolesuccinocarboxamide synthase [Saprospiraceae bacterium]
MNEIPTIFNTNFTFPQCRSVYKGKVRDIYYFDEFIVAIATDRISAFDHILPKPIPYKGQVLNQLAAYFLQQTSDIVPNWFYSSPDPNVTIGKHCQPIKIEMVVRGYLAGHAWRTYRNGGRALCGVQLPEGLSQNDPFSHPILTPSTKADEGHDEDISVQEILSKGLVSGYDWQTLESHSLKLFERGTTMAAERGLILVDTKYEFGKYGDTLLLIDEVHTPDSSRYFYWDGYKERQEMGIPQKQLSKEFVREWLMDNHFQGKEGQVIPEMPTPFIKSVSERYIQLYELLTGKDFEKEESCKVNDRIYENTMKAIKDLL